MTQDYKKRFTTKMLERSLEADDKKYTGMLELVQAIRPQDFEHLGEVALKLMTYAVTSELAQEDLLAEIRARQAAGLSVEAAVEELRRAALSRKGDTG